MTRTVLVYDVSEQRRRTKLAHLLERYGRRVQYSVFEAWLSPAQAARIVAEAARIIDGQTDQLRLYAVCARCARELRLVGRPGQTLAEEPGGYRLV